MIIPFDIKLIYIVECGFYIHSTYATLFMDARRKDFYVMIAHHVLTLMLISISYALR
jgi:ceramide synthetase